MKALKLTLDHFHFSGSLDPDIILVKRLDFDLEKTGPTVFLSATAPILKKVTLELDFITYKNDVLSLNILSDRKIADLLFGFARRFLKDLSYVDLDYPTLRINTDIMMKELKSDTKIRNIDLVGNLYIIDLELN
jgi:hypothetical protein